MVARGKAAQRSRRGASKVVAPAASSRAGEVRQGESSSSADRQAEGDAVKKISPEIAGDDKIEDSDDMVFGSETQVEGLHTFEMEGDGEDIEGEAEGEFAEWIEEEDADAGEFPGDAVDENSDGEGNNAEEEKVGENEEAAEEEMLDYEEGLDETGELETEEVHEDFDPEGSAGDREDAAHGDTDNTDEEEEGNLNMDENVDIGWVEELWNQKQIEDSRENKTKGKAKENISGQGENESVKPKSKQNEQAAENTMRSPSKTKKEGSSDLTEDKEAARKGGNGHDDDKDGGDKSFETEEKVDEASSNDEEDETEEKMTARRKQKQIELTSIPRCFFGPPFDKSYFRYSICVYPVVQNDFSQPGIQAIASIAGSVSFVQQEHPNHKVMRLLTTHKMARLMEKILFSTFCSNNLTIEVERREPTKFIKESVEGAEINYPTSYTKVVNKVTFRQKNAYTRRFLMDKRTSKNTGRNVKYSSLFLQNLPSSMDENFLGILFPRSRKVGLVKVSSDIRSAVLQMQDHSTAYHHLICFTNFYIDGRDIQMSVVDMSQEEALNRYNMELQKGKETLVHRQKTQVATAADESQQKQAEKASDSAASKSSPGKKVSHERESSQTSSRNKGDRSSSSSKRGVASDSRSSEKTLDSKKDVAATEHAEKPSKSKDQEKRDKERKDRPKSDKERLERERREQNSKEKERQRVSRERQRLRRDDVAIRRRREERIQRHQQTERRRREEREIELQREFQMQREIKIRREMDMQLEIEKQRELERLKMEQLQELERQKLERRQKEQLQLIMIEQERQLQAREEAARKLKDMEFEEDHRRQREKEERKRELERKRERELERSRERQEERRRQQERQREIDREQSRKRHDQDRGRHENLSRWDPPATKKGRLSSPPARQQQDSYEDSFSHKRRDGRQDHRSPGRSSAGVGYGQSLLGSPPRPQTSGDHRLRQTLEKEVAKQAEELQRNLALLAEFQNDPSRAVRNLAKVDPSLAPITTATQSVSATGRPKRPQETVVLKQQAMREVEMGESEANKESYGHDISSSYMSQEYGIGNTHGHQSRPFQHSDFQQQQRERQNHPLRGRGGRLEQTSAGRGRHKEQLFERGGHQAEFKQGGLKEQVRHGPYGHSSFERGDHTDQSFTNAYMEEPYYGQEEMEQTYYGEDEPTNESSYGMDSHMGQASFGRSGHMNQSSFGRGGEMAPSSYGRGGQMAQPSFARTSQMEQKFARQGLPKQPSMGGRDHGRKPVNETGSYNQPATGSMGQHGILGEKPESFKEGSYQQQDPYKMYGNERQMQAEPAKAYAAPGQRGRGAMRMGDSYRGRGHGGQGRGASHQQIVDYSHGNSNYDGSQNYY